VQVTLSEATGKLVVRDAKGITKEINFPFAKAKGAAGINLDGYGHFAAVLLGSGAFYVVDLEKGNWRGPITDSEGEVRCAALNPDGNIAAWANSEGTLVTKPLEGKDSKEKRWPAGAKDVQSLAFSPTGRHLLAGDGGNRIREWDLRTPGKCCDEEIAPDGKPVEIRTRQTPVDLATSSESLLVASLDEAHAFQFWDPVTGLPAGGSLRVPGDPRRIAFRGNTVYLLLGNGHELKWPVFSEETRKAACRIAATDKESLAFVTRLGGPKTLPDCSDTRR
jgi:WD40 repeat protein